MALGLVAMPFIRQERTGSSPAVQRDALPEAATQTWLAGALVTNTAGALVGCAANATLVYGLSPDAAKGSATPAALLKPPFTLFGLNHFPFELKERVLEINATTGGVIDPATGITWAGVPLVAGQQGGLAIGTGAYAGYQFFDTAASNKIFTIVGLAPYQDVTLNNPRILVKVVDTALQ